MRLRLLAFNVSHTGYGVLQRNSCQQPALLQEGNGFKTVELSCRNIKKQTPIFYKSGAVITQNGPISIRYLVGATGDLSDCMLLYFIRPNIQILYRIALLLESDQDQSPYHSQISQAK